MEGSPKGDDKPTKREDLNKYVIDSSSSESRQDFDSSVEVHSVSSRGASFSASKSDEVFEGKHITTKNEKDSRFIGAVGIHNEGTTCYLNSLLQVLFHLNYFRSSVYRIPTDENIGDEVPSVYQALQELFFQMQERTTPVRAKRLTEAFEWGEEDLFIQQDIQEMATLLRDNLEEKMKGTVTEGAINQMFVGYGEQVVETLDHTYVSRNRDMYYDIHLPLCDQFVTLLDSLKSLTAKDKLVGDNKYRVEEDGKPVEYKDAEKGYEFKRFPPVTWFHIKRFAMDLSSPTLEMKKVNSRLEFPTELDLTELEKGFTNEELVELEKNIKRGSAVKSMITSSPAIYDLNAVIVHRGSVRSGHYYCYIRDWDPQLGKFGRWLEYDDEDVRAVSEETAVQTNFGNLRGSGNTSTGVSAYILSYVRRADAPFIFAPSPTDIISQTVKDAMIKSIREEERQQRDEKELRERVVVFVVTDRSISHFCQSQQMNLFTRDCRSVGQFIECVLHFRKDELLTTVYENLAESPSLRELGVQKDNCRLWRWTTTRLFYPCSALVTYKTARDNKVLISAVLSQTEKDQPTSLCLYLQTALPLRTRLSPTTAVDPLLLYFLREGDGACRVRFRQPIKTQCFFLYLNTRVSSYSRVRIRAVHNSPITSDCDTNKDADGDEGPGERREKENVKQGRGSTHAKTNETKTSREVSDDEENEEKEEESDDGENDQLEVSCVIRDGVVRVTLEQEFDISVELHITCLVEKVAINSVHFNVNLDALEYPEPLSTSQLVDVGHDRILLFFKFFDHMTSNTQYVGSLLVDRAATLGSLEGQLASMMGIGAVAAPNRLAHPTDGNFFAFFEEGKSCIQRELPPNLDLAACDLSGGLIVFQRRSIPPLYRHLTVETYFRTLNSTVDINLVEIKRILRDNREETKAALTAHEALREKLKTNKTSGACSSPSSLPLPEKEDIPSTTTPSAKAATNEPYVADPDLDPYNTTLPVTGAVQFVPASQGDMCTAVMTWSYETLCDHIGAIVQENAQFLALYRCDGNGEPCAEALRGEEDVTLETILYGGSSYSTSKTVFYLRLPSPRSALEKTLILRVTLRDREGHALHHERYLLGNKDRTLTALIQMVRKSVQPWEIEKDVWGTIAQTLQSPHYVLYAVEKKKSVIRYIVELPSPDNDTDEDSEEEEDDIFLSAELASYDLVLQPMPPLARDEERIACCHGEVHLETPRLFGTPFVITVTSETSVREALDLMLRATHLPREALIKEDKWTVMMLTDIHYHFKDWGAAIHLYWRHTQNSSRFIPSLMINHKAPKEKPGSRYVAQNSTQLKISKK